MSEPPRTKSQLRRKVSLPTDARAAGEPLGPDEETLVPCPVCKRGMIHPVTRARVQELLQGADIAKTETK